MQKLDPEALKRMLRTIVDARRHMDGLYHPEGIAIRQTLHDALDPDRVRNAEARIAHVARARTALVTRNAPSHLMKLDLHAPLDFAFSMQQLLDVAKTQDKTRKAMMLRSEATMLFDGALFVQLYDELRSERDRRMTCDAFSRSVQEAFFVGEGNQRFWSVHNPAKFYTTESVSFHRNTAGAQRMVRSWDVYSRKVRVPGIHRDVWIIFLSRPKDPASIYFKVLLNAEDPLRANNPLTIHDEGGFKLFVVESDEERAKDLVRALLQQVQTHAQELGATITEELSGNLLAPPNTKADSRNPSSRPTYKVLKFIAQLNDVSIEVQGQTLRAFADQEVAVTDANHAFYELEKCVNSHFPRFFPTRAFGIEWNKTEYEKLERLRRQTLGLLSAYENP